MKGLPEQDEITDPARVYAIGDVHGHVDRLRQLYDAIRADWSRDRVPSAQVVHLGDYVDRGPDSAACLRLLREGSPISAAPVVHLRGNHEQMMIDALDRPDRVELWLVNGGDATLASFGVGHGSSWLEWRQAVPSPDSEFIRSLPLVHVTARFVFVHAGVRPGIRLAMQDSDDLLWIREEFLGWPGVMLPDAPQKLVVHGHTPVATPDLRGNRLCIDTNAARGGPLTCAVLSSDSVYFLQV